MKKWKRITALGLSAMMIAHLQHAEVQGTKKSQRNLEILKEQLLLYGIVFTGADGDMLVKMVDKYNKEK